MCIIAIIENVRLSDDQVDQMYEANKHGGGVAWRQWDEDLNETVVRWKKGLFKDEMLELNRTLPMPYVLHFRVPSGGTSASFLACHPFAIDDNATVSFEGQTNGFVLFHNGFWNDWRAKMQAISISGAWRVPSGPWSDSRGLAWAANHLGLGFLDLIDEKVVAFGPGDDDIEIFGSWQTVKNPDPETGEEKSILVSNKIWERTTTVYSGHSVNDRRRINGGSTTSQANANQSTLALAAGAVSPNRGEQAGGAAHQDTFCGSHHESSESFGTQAGQQESVQEADEGINRAALEGNSTLTGVANRKCALCTKTTAAGSIVGGSFHCWQCWSQQTKIGKGFVGLCQTCKASYGGAKKVIDNQWICLQCWETWGRPRVYWVARDGKTVRSVEEAS